MPSNAATVWLTLMPDPPYSSGMHRPSNPSSAACFHRAGSFSAAASRACRSPVSSRVASWRYSSRICSIRSSCHGCIVGSPRLLLPGQTNQSSSGTLRTTHDGVVACTIASTSPVCRNPGLGSHASSPAPGCGGYLSPCRCQNLKIDTRVSSSSMFWISTK